jgi:hypothetical protein
LEEGAAADTAAEGGPKEVQARVSDTALDKGLEGEWAQINPPFADSSLTDREDGGPIQPTQIRSRRNILSKRQINTNTCNLLRTCNLPSRLAILSSPCRASQRTQTACISAMACAHYEAQLCPRMGRPAQASPLLLGKRQSIGRLKGFQNNGAPPSCSQD